MGAHWVPGARFVDEYTFSLFEGIFERRASDFDHFGSVEILGPEWSRILADLAELRTALIRAEGDDIAMPFGSTLRIEDEFRNELLNNQRGLIALLAEMNEWVGLTLRDHECISILGL